jgi:hypothetical protein
MRPLGVVVDAPALDQNLSFLERVEYLPVQELVPQLAVKALVVAVLPGTAGFDKQRLNADPAEPLSDSRGGKFRTIVRPNVIGRPMPDEQLRQALQDALRRLADCIENDELDSGFHPVKDNVGKNIGTVYLDHTGELI